MSEYLSPPVDSITGLDILKMLNAPTDYKDFVVFCNKGGFVKDNPAYRGGGRWDEQGMKVSITNTPNHSRLQIGKWFLLLIGENDLANRPNARAGIYVYQVSKPDAGADLAHGENELGVVYKHIQFGSLVWDSLEGFQIFKNRVFYLTDIKPRINSGSWSNKCMHYQIWSDIIDLSQVNLINWPYEKPQGLI